MTQTQLVACLLVVASPSTTITQKKLQAGRRCLDRLLGRSRSRCRRRRRRCCDLSVSWWGVDVAWCCRRRLDRLLLLPLLLHSHVRLGWQGVVIRGVVAAARARVTTIVVHDRSVDLDAGRGSRGRRRRSGDDDDERYELGGLTHSSAGLLDVLQQLHTLERQLLSRVLLWADGVPRGRRWRWRRRTRVCRQAGSGGASERVIEWVNKFERASESE
jgi:hypothetical protein